MFELGFEGRVGIFGGRVFQMEGLVVQRQKDRKVRRVLLYKMHGGQREGSTTEVKR